MPEFEIVEVAATPWVSLRKVVCPDAGINGYVYAHENRCGGQIVAVLPYQDTRHGRRYLLRRDVNPCWGPDPVLVSLTGGCEGGLVEDDAVREVAEEAGYMITRGDLIPLGGCRGGKASDTVYHLFAVNVTGLEQGPALGDGSRLEAEGTTEWLYEDELADVDDPQAVVMWARLVKVTRTPLAQLRPYSVPGGAPRLQSV